MSYDAWKLQHPVEYDLGGDAADDTTCDCGQPLEGGNGSLCIDCTRECVENEIIKRCSCGRMFTRTDWNELPCIGTQWFDDTPDEVLEMRNCKCGSTIAMEVKS